MNYNPINSSLRSLGWVKFTFVLFLWIFVGFVNKAVGQEAYAVESLDKTTLTFYYDTQRASRTGTVYNLNTGTNHPGWTAKEYPKKSILLFDARNKTQPLTLAHEMGHILGLDHSFMNTSEYTTKKQYQSIFSNQTYVFKPNSTFNLMDYVASSAKDNRIFTWCWQWKMMNGNVPDTTNYYMEFHSKTTK